MPQIEIVEQYIKGKRKDESLNEDGLIITDRYIAVIDGASSASKFDGISGGLIAKNVLKNGINNLESFTNGYEAINKLNQLLFLAQKGYPESRFDPRKRMMASLIIYSIENREVWGYGDCKCLINGKEYQFDKKIDGINAEVRSFVNSIELEKGVSYSELLDNDVGAKMIAEIILSQPYLANKDVEYGYPILDGFQLCESLYFEKKVQVGDEIVLATDGYPKIFNSLKKSEEYLSSVLKKDQLCIKENKSVKGFYKGLNSFDDRSYIRFKVL